ncbi:MAG: nucleotidyltransferase domain-containing protein [Selenomonadaceae bacterium]|nr:nucleotidyltransferase domain-containing protein [Selenomonadaceae bacterium]
MNDLENIFQRDEYNFLREDERLGKNIAYLTVAGSIAYGTNVETSDEDIRGFAIEDFDSILTGKAFEQFDDDKTDTVIYGLRKYFKLCADCNPNVLELLGTKPEHILYMSDAGKKVRDNAEIFLSKLAYKKFVGYATAQLRRLQNALAHDSYPQREKNLHVLKSIKSMMTACQREYGLNHAEINFDTDGDEIFVSIQAQRLPLKKFFAMNSGLGTMINNYAKLNHRNRKKDENHLHKHAMHLIRLYLTGIDILEGRGIVTYREKDLPLLKKIRAGEIPLDDVFKMADECDEKISAAYKNSKLPEVPDYQKIDKLLIEIYRKHFAR